MVSTFPGHTHNRDLQQDCKECTGVRASGSGLVLVFDARDSLFQRDRLLAVASTAGLRILRNGVRTQFSKQKPTSHDTSGTPHFVLRPYQAFCECEAVRASKELWRQRRAAAVDTSSGYKSTRLCIQCSVKGKLDFWHWPIHPSQQHIRTCRTNFRPHCPHRPTLPTIPYCETGL